MVINDIFICISCITSEFEHLFLQLKAIQSSSSLNCLLMLVTHFVTVLPVLNTHYIN